MKGGAYEVNTRIPLPFTLSVESPADETGVRAPADVLALQDQLFHHERCGLQTCGWAPHFTVTSESDGVLTRVKSLLADAGCTVKEERLYRMRHEEFSPHHYRQLDPWNSEWELTECRVSPVEDKVEESVPDPYEAQVETFLHELEAVLLQRHLQPDDFDELLRVAHDIVDHEDPQTGPHVRLIIPLEELVHARQKVQGTGVLEASA